MNGYDLWCDESTTVNALTGFEIAASTNYDVNIVSRSMYNYNSNTMLKAEISHQPSLIPRKRYENTKQQLLFFRDSEFVVLWFK